MDWGTFVARLPFMLWLHPIVFKETSDGLTDYTACHLTVGYLPSLNQISAVSQTGLLNVDTSQLVSKFSLCVCIPVTFS